MRCSYQSPEAAEPFTLHEITNSVLDLNGSQIVDFLVAGLQLFGTLFWHFSTGSSASLKVRLSFNQPGPYHHEELNCNSDIVIPLEGRSTGLVTPGQ